MSEKYYYKLINDNTGYTTFYVSVDVPVQDDKVCEVLNLEGYHAESCTKEEYEREVQPDILKD